MEREAIVKKLTPLVKDVFGDGMIVVSNEMSPETTETWTSLSFMQLLSRIESEFNFKFKIFELISIHNMGDLITAIAKHCE